MRSKAKSQSSEDTEETPITYFEAHCTNKLCDFSSCRHNNTPGPATYTPKLPRKHIAGAQFSNLTARNTDIVPPYPVGPASYNTHLYKAIKPILETHNAKLKAEAVTPKEFYKPRQGRTRDYIYSNPYRRSLIKTLMEQSPEDGFVELELVRDGDKVDLVRQAGRQQVIAMRKLLAQTGPGKDEVTDIEPPVL